MSSQPGSAEVARPRRSIFEQHTDRSVLANVPDRVLYLLTRIHDFSFTIAGLIMIAATTGIAGFANSASDSRDGAYRSAGTSPGLFPSLSTARLRTTYQLTRETRTPCSGRVHRLEF